MDEEADKEEDVDDKEEKEVRKRRVCSSYS